MATTEEEMESTSGEDERQAHLVSMVKTDSSSNSEDSNSDDEVKPNFDELSDKYEEIIDEFQKVVDKYKLLKKYSF